jgi:hypothetical protein
MQLIYVITSLIRSRENVQEKLLFFDLLGVTVRHLSVMQINASVE